MNLTAYDLGAKPDIREIHEGRKRRQASKSVSQLCREAGLYRNAVASYRYKHPGTTLTNEQIVAHLVARRTESIAAKARAAGQAPHLVASRLRRGMPLDMALTLPPLTPSEIGRAGGRARAVHRGAAA